MEMTKALKHSKNSAETQTNGIVSQNEKHSEYKSQNITKIVELIRVCWHENFKVCAHDSSRLSVFFC